MSEVISNTAKLRFPPNKPPCSRFVRRPIFCKTTEIRLRKINENGHLVGKLWATWEVKLGEFVTSTAKGKIFEAEQSMFVQLHLFGGRLC